MFNESILSKALLHNWLPPFVQYMELGLLVDLWYNLKFWLPEKIGNVDVRDLFFDLISSYLLLLGRLRINCCGMLDVLKPLGAMGRSIAQVQHEDLMNLGRLIISLSCKAMSVNQPINKCLGQSRSHIYTFLCHIFAYLPHFFSRLI